MKQKDLIKRSLKIKKFRDMEKGYEDIELDIFYDDNEWMITNYDVVNIYDNYEEFKSALIKLILC